MRAGHHYTNIGLLFMSFPFVFASNKNFSFAFTFIRFAFCFMMFTAALWKIGRGNLWHTEQLYALLLTDYLKYAVAHTSMARAAALAWLLHYKLLNHLIWELLIFLEALFILGFLSLKYDRILLVSYLLFFIGGWALMDIYDYENLFFLLTLAPVLKGITVLKKCLHS